MTQSEKTISEVLRAKILACGESFQGLERLTGIKRQCLMRFVKEQGTLRLDAADKLADFFGLELRPVVKAAKTTKNSNPSKGIADPNKDAK
jgi:plasmid maintenance system antidote protein VapI